MECEPGPYRSPWAGDHVSGPFSQGPFKLLPVMLRYCSPSRFVEHVSNDNVSPRADFMETTELQKPPDPREPNSTISLRSFWGGFSCAFIRPSFFPVEFINKLYHAKLFP